MSHLRVGKEDVVLIELLDQDPAFVLMFFVAINGTTKKLKDVRIQPAAGWLRVFISMPLISRNYQQVVFFLLRCLMHAQMYGTNNGVFIRGITELSW